MIWQRYILKEILKVFFLFLLCFFFLYALIDYSMHMQEILKNKKISWGDLSMYYSMLFSKRCDLLLPLSLLISSVKVLTSLNKRNELLALQAAGIALHRLTRPFFFVGLICVGISYFNFEVLAPRSLNFIDQFEEKYLKKRPHPKGTKTAVHVLPLKDGSRLLYQSYDQETKEFFDLFWVQSSDEIIHMKTLRLDSPHPVGTFVDEMRRNRKGQIEKIASETTRVFDSLTLDFTLQNHFEYSMENRSITQLATMTLKKTPLFIENRPVVHTYLYFKLFMPWLPVLVLIGVVPFCVISSRTHPTFLVFSLTIFGYIAFFTLMDGCVVLGEMQVVPPFWAIFTLPIAFFFIFGPRFIKMCL
ncbi:MAG: LptF/LptG family permease, partial [Chlamydiia bacterium]|nr:LptF/LptG family permease [Chlamydiia bacterium]